MACFTVPMSLAVITTLSSKKVPKKLHVGWLNTMLWGGVLMLLIEHIAHQEVVLYPPFFTAGLAEMFPEMMRVGIPMTAGIVAIWGAMVTISNLVERRRESLS